MCEPRDTSRRCRTALALVAFGLAALLPRAASAFCGFYVGGADAKLFNNATQVVLMREGTRTVLSMQNDYEGPPERFAMVVPVPVILQKENVKTLPKEVFEKIDKLSAPRLVEYWEQDPCRTQDDTLGFGGLGLSGLGSGGGGRGTGLGLGDLGVKVEAQFDVGEYDIVILSAKDASGLDTWLREEKYAIPQGAEPYFRPYVQAGSKFFVARVDPKRVTIDKGHAALSPLRFHYDSADFTLPVRLGLINSRGTQDLVVNVLAAHRYEPANYPTVTIPTNFDVAEGARERFGAFYAALFDRTLEKNPKAIVTEYAWDASTCDPCPGPALSQDDLATLGADVIPAASESPMTPRVTAEPATGTVSPSARSMVPRRFLGRVRACWTAAHGRHVKPGRIEVKVSWTDDGKVKEAAIAKNETGDAELGACVKKPFETAVMPPEGAAVVIPYVLTLAPSVPFRRWTITRLHARYTKDSLGEDIVFRQASPIVGGREVTDAKGQLEHGASASTVDNFQGRYAIRHPWIGPIDCKAPKRGVWGGPWEDVKIASTSPSAATGIGLVSREALDLSRFVRKDLPELDVRAGRGSLAGATVDAGAASQPSPAESAAPVTRPSASGCKGCATSPRSTAPWPWAALLGVAVAFARRRRRPDDPAR